MPFPYFIRKLFQNDGAGEKLNPDIMPTTVNGVAADASGNITIKGANIEGGPFLPAAGGYIEYGAVYRKKGDLEFVGIDNRSYMIFAAGASAGYADKAGAALIMAAANAPANRIQVGSFSLAASDGNNLSVLEGLPGGGLNWAGHPVGILVGDGNGYARFQSGLQICWGRTSWGNLTRGWSGADKAVSFALPFVDTNYGLTTGTDFGGSGFSYFMCTCTERTTTGFKHSCWWNESSSVHRTVEAVATWAAIGRWK